MAKSWKSFVKKEDAPAQAPGSSSELPGLEKELNLSLAELAQSNAGLKAILQERDALEEKMRELANPSAKKEEVNPRFSGGIDSINQKKKEDQKRFETKRKLEEKIRQKNEELDAWTKKVNRFKEKVNTTKARFDEEKKKLAGLKKKLKPPATDGFDYDKIREPLKKIVDDFPFTERKPKAEESLVDKPLEAIKEKIRENTVVKKIVDAWQIARDKKREAEKIKGRFDEFIGDKNDRFSEKEKYEKLFDDPGSDALDDIFEAQQDDQEDSRDKSVAAKSEAKKTALLEKLKNRKKESEGQDRPKKAKGFSTDDLDREVDNGTAGEPADETESPRNTDDEEEANDFEKNDQLKRERLEQKRAERREARAETDAGNRSRKTKDTGEEDSGSDANEVAAQKKREKEDEEKNDLAKKEELRQSRLEQKREESKSDARREERREERKRKSTDKFNS